MFVINLRIEVDTDSRLSAESITEGFVAVLQEVAGFIPENTAISSEISDE